MQTATSRTETFGKAHRLRSRREFQAIQRHGKRRHSAHFIVISTDRPTGDTARLGVTVSKTVGNAVVRNRVKRRVRELFRSARRALARTLDVVVIAKAGAGDLTSAATRAELTPVLGI